MTSRPTVPPTTPVVVAARRTPVGTAGSALRSLDVVDLAAAVVAALVADLGTGAPAVDDVVLGNTRGPGGNPARVAALAAGLGDRVPGTTVDRQCGSGQEAVHVAAAAVASGAALLVLAGGAESASTAPLRAYRAGTPGGGPPGSDPVPYDRAAFAPRSADGLGDPDMGPAAEDVARRAGVTRGRQDAYALRSHARTLAAAARGDFDAELVPVAGLSADQRPRAGLTPGLLARFPGAFEPGGTVTAGNSCGVSDGAAMVAVVPEHVRAALGVPGLAIRSWVAVGVDPRTPGLGPVPAVREALRRSSRRLADVEVLEVTEAFAAQVLACTDALGLDPLGGDAERVCPQGGAIAQGHPWGASGALLVVRLFAQLVRVDGPRTGVATCAVGGGQGLALVADRVG
jgi:acetyl-CoA C-acetyltransferase